MSSYQNGRAFKSETRELVNASDLQFPSPWAQVVALYPPVPSLFRGVCFLSLRPSSAKSLNSSHLCCLTRFSFLPRWMKIAWQSEDAGWDRLWRVSLTPAILRRQSGPPINDAYSLHDSRLTSTCNMYAMMLFRSAEYRRGRRAKVPLVILLARSFWLDAVNGGRKAHSSYSKQPSDQMSDFSLYDM